MNKKLLLFLALSGTLCTAMAQKSAKPAIPRDEKIEQQVEALLGKMSLDEKVGQMCELSIDVISKRVTLSATSTPLSLP